MAAASHEAAARPRSTAPARMGLDAPGGQNSTASVPQRSTATVSERKSVPQNTARAESFAVLEDDFEADDPGQDFLAFAGLDAKEWRVETRYRWRKDGKEIIYWNYRRRKIHHDADGNRRIEYRKGGSRER